ncbi:Phosphatidylinositol 3,4,5-trisphosphate-dependent Rac exchanger 1 protein [Trichoplax sp. H2]|nr:Phosphatidylinositol 3,4,5-trisphosphate-dependent Rac exchanger 1 protein [Trichoplax sp. H2]|eukprot:RDD47749.1 Phosphatidylinositol 3,4,5-trisphosphate-dependent Rac exchanger 1 protein [Trichoplax sp. H2]
MNHETRNKSQEKMDKIARIRLMVLNEIVSTEQVYAKNLRFLVKVKEILLARSSKKLTSCISISEVESLMGNVEELYQLSCKLLHDMNEKNDDKNSIANTFFTFAKDLKIYASYCNSHEVAIGFLEDILKDQLKSDNVKSCVEQAAKVEGMEKVTKGKEIDYLASCLVTPVQRICKYPLLFKELLRQTPESHVDYQTVLDTFQEIKNVCSEVNEIKRQLEELESLEELVASIKGWTGLDFSKKEVKILKKGSLMKLTPHGAEELYFILFKKQLICCKKESRSLSQRVANVTLGATEYTYRGKIMTRGMNIESVKDGKVLDKLGNHKPVYNAWKIYNMSKGKWITVYASSQEEKNLWLEALTSINAKRPNATGSSAPREKYISRRLVIKAEQIYQRIHAESDSIIRYRTKKDKVGVDKCFTGSDLVSWLMKNDLSSTVEEAIKLGQTFQECNLIHHVDDQIQFDNHDYWYRFRYDDGTYEDATAPLDALSISALIYFRLHGMLKPTLKNYKDKLKVFPQSVTGIKLVNWLIEQGDVDTREEGCVLGQLLCETKYLRHVNDRGQFKDSNQLYRFHTDEIGYRESGNVSPTDNDGKFKIIDEITLLQSIIPVEDYSVEKDSFLSIPMHSNHLASPRLSSRSPSRESYFSRSLAPSLQNSPTESDDSLEIKDVETIPVPTHLNSEHPELLRTRSLTSLISEDNTGFDTSSVYFDDIDQVDDESYKESRDRFESTSTGNSMPRQFYRRVSSISSGSYSSLIENTAESLGDEASLKDSGYSRERHHSIFSSDSDISSVVSLSTEISTNYEYLTIDKKPCQLQERVTESDLTTSVPAELYYHFSYIDERLLQELESIEVEFITPNDKEDDVSTSEDSSKSDLARQQLKAMKLLGADEMVNKEKSGIRRKLLKSFSKTRKKASPEMEFSSAFPDQAAKLLGVSNAETIPSKSSSPIGDQKKRSKSWANSYTNFLSTIKERIDNYRESASSLNCIKCQGEAKQENNNLIARYPFCPLRCYLHELEVYCSTNYRPSLVPETHNGEDIDYLHLKEFTYPVDGLLVTRTIHSKTGMAIPSGVMQGFHAGGLKRLLRGKQDFVAKCRHMLNQIRIFLNEMDNADNNGLKERNKCNSFMDMIEKLNAIVSSNHIKLIFQQTESNRPLLLSEVKRDFTTISTELIALLNQADKDTEENFNCIETFNKKVEKLKQSLREVRLRLLMTIFSDENTKCVERRDAVFSQALTAVLSTFISQLYSAIHDIYNNLQEYTTDSESTSAKWLQQLSKIGLLVYFQALLSSRTGSETAMLEDMSVAIQDLSKIAIRFKLLDDSMFNTADEYQVVFEGDRSDLDVIINLGENLFQKLPDALQRGQSVQVTPVLFTHGLEKVEDKTDPENSLAIHMQTAINTDSLKSLRKYYRKFKNAIFDTKHLPRSSQVVCFHRLYRPLYTAEKLIKLLDKCIMDASMGQDNANILLLSSEAAARIGAIQIVGCRSGAERTLAAITMEQAYLLCRSYELPPELTNHVIKSFRNRGTSSQMLSGSRVRNDSNLPRLYRYNFT